MLTFFTTSKPFRGHSAVIQRNALKSWKLLNPEVEVILFGADEGAAEVCAELGLRYEPNVTRDEFGSKRIDYFFDRAQEIAQYPVLCYANCDIILQQDFVDSLMRVQEEKRFLMIGRRWDTDIDAPLDFAAPQWAEEIARRARAANRQRSGEWIDYFSFSKGLYLHKIPPFAIGRVHWDNWLVWFAAEAGAVVVDASDTILAIHQNHDYSYHPQGKDGLWKDPGSARNLKLAGGFEHLRTIADARYRLTHAGIGPNRLRRFNNYFASIRRQAVQRSSLVLSLWQTFAWHPFLNKTRSFRNALGLRRP
jgi:hypothetical protein